MKYYREVLMALIVSLLFLLYSILEESNSSIVKKILMFILFVGFLVIFVTLSLINQLARRVDIVQYRIDENENEFCLLKEALEEPPRKQKLK